MERVILRLANNVLTNPNSYVVDKGQLSSATETWERSIRLQGGFWSGKFKITGGLYELNNIFNQWLGFDVSETVGNKTWEGLIYSMELHHNIVRERSIEPVSNAIKVMYGELLENTGFETVGVGTTFDSWNEVVAGTDIIWNEVVVQATGEHAIRIQNLDAGTDTYVYQTVNVLPNTPYRVSFYCRGDGIREGRYAIYDQSNALDLIAQTNTGNTSTTWKKVVNDIVTPAGCTQITLFLMNISGHTGNTYYDDTSIRLLVNEKVGQSETDWAVVQPSINQYGRKERIVDGSELASLAAVTLRDTELGKSSWPVTKRAGRGSNEAPYVMVYVSGYIFTTNWVYTTQRQYGSSSPADALIESLLGECQYVNSVVVRTNNTAVRLDMSNKRVWDTLKRVVEVGSGEGIWRLYMTSGRTAVYEKMDMTPKYVMRHGQFYDKLSVEVSTSPYRMVPAVVRDYDYTTKYVEPGSIFQDRRDFLLEEVVASPKGLEWQIFEI